MAAASVTLRAIGPCTARGSLDIKRGQLGEEIPREHLGDLAIMSEYTGVHG